MKNTNINWCFAIINGRKGEVFFRKLANGEKRIIAHYYLRDTDPVTKKMKKTIAKESSQLRIVYRNKKYRIIKDIH